MIAHLGSERRPGLGRLLGVRWSDLLVSLVDLGVVGRGQC